MNIVLAKTVISIAALLVTAALLFKRASLTDWLEKKIRERRTGRRVGIITTSTVHRRVPGR
jgi:hypothetical protein